VKGSAPGDAAGAHPRASPAMALARRQKKGLPESRKKRPDLPPCGGLRPARPPASSRAPPHPAASERAAVRQRRLRREEEREELLEAFVMGVTEAGFLRRQLVGDWDGGDGSQWSRGCVAAVGDGKF
jgi:hypothetical protein